ncbi:MAG: hypothetical protein Q4G04_00555 [bacterium]|nr:hypothetical protein [bacterium]
MNVLENYKKLSNEDKNNLTSYCIYRSIYDVASNNDVILDDKVVESIKELSMEVYLDDETYNYSESEISDFITNCYLNNNQSLDKIADADYCDILQAMEIDDNSFYRDDDFER